MYKKIYSDLGVISVWITLVAISSIIPSTVIRTSLAIPVLLFFPGYVLLAALFPKKDDIDINVRVALSFGLSIVIVLLMGLLLNFTFGITLLPILGVLYIYTIVLVIIGIYIRGKLPEEIRFSISIDSIYYIISQKLKPKNILDLMLNTIILFLILSTVGVIYYTVTMPKVGERYTEFYILNSSGNTNNYPAKVMANSNTTLLIGVVNHEYSPINYTVQVDLNKKLLTSKTLSLDNSETWEKNVTFSINKGANMELEFLLYKENNFTIPYRTLHLWVNAT